VDPDAGRRVARALFVNAKSGGDVEPSAQLLDSGRQLVLSVLRHSMDDGVNTSHPPIEPHPLGQPVAEIPTAEDRIKSLED